MTTVFACFILVSGIGQEYPTAYHKWEYVEVPNQETMLAFAAHLRESPFAVEWQCRPYTFKTKEGQV